MTSTDPGTFTALQVTATKALTPGQHYVLTVAAAATHDLAGNASTAGSTTFRAAQTVEEAGARAPSCQSKEPRIVTLVS